MEKQDASFKPINIKTERDLRKNIREICMRFNQNPDLGRLLLVNPVLAFEDAGVEMTKEIKQHIMQTLRFPEKLKTRTAQLENELKHELAELEIPAELPLTSEWRAHLLFRVLSVKPLDEDAFDTGRLESRRTRFYARKHPLIAKLAEWERAQKGGLIFHTKGSYNAYKTGKKRHNWVKAVRFDV